MLRYPLIQPHPPRLSEQLSALREVEASGTYSNNGPQVRALEAEAAAQLFGDAGECLAVANATLGLMIAIRDAAGPTPARDRLAMVPALTFAATAQAAQWAGLTPLVVDVDAAAWTTCPAAEERLLREHGERIAVLVPYATFGTALDLDRYAWLARRFGVGVVIDAAASLGSLDAEGRGFGAGAPFAVVCSMHATKTFAVGEGGLIHSGDRALIARLRQMANFGFDDARSAVLPGLNAKLPEVMAVLARARLHGFDAIAANRAAIATRYRAALDGWAMQEVRGTRIAPQFMSVLLPPAAAQRRHAIAATLAERGIGTGRYFSPHLGQHPALRRTALIEPTPVADDLAARLISLPVTDAMVPDDASAIAEALPAACARTRPASPRVAVTPAVAEVVVVGGGPAGSAMLTAAAKAGTLAQLAAGTVLVERHDAIGGGRLGRYAITSDSTAQTFLTAIENNPEPALAALVDHPAAQAVARHRDALGVPLATVGPLLRATGDRLAELVRHHGGSVLCGHEALATRRTPDGLWQTRLRRIADGAIVEQLSRAVVVATGGHQPLDRLAAQVVAGQSLVALAGDRLVQSDAVLSLGGPEMVADLLAGKRDPRIAVVGGSTSALTAIALLLRQVPPLPLGDGAITLLHRRPLRPFYPSAAAAQAEGFTDFGSDDICPVSGFVYRLAGFRLEARELVLRMLGVDGRRPEPRVRCQRLGDDDDAARAVLEGADLVIAALGYRPHGLRIEDVDGRALPLAADRGEALVDPHCRVRDAAGVPVPGLYGIGLAAGFVPWGPLGGEASFSGQANGLWLWQNDVGRMIVDQLLAGRVRAAA